MSEAAAFNAWYSHSSRCGMCRPTSGIVCDEGRKLHDLWQQAALVDHREYAAEAEKLDREERASRRVPRPPRPAGAALRATRRGGVR